MAFSISSNLLHFFGDGIEICFCADAIKEWVALNPSSDFPAHPSSQKSWDAINVLRLHELLTASYTSDVDQARLLAVRAPEASSWLHARPSANIGTLMDTKSFRIAVGLRIGSKICEPHMCHCRAKVDRFGHHGLSCPRNSGRFSRHFLINSIIQRALSSANIPAILEPSGLSRSDGKRPDGLSLIPWSKGKSLIWDATCVDTFAPSHLPLTRKQPGSAALSAVTLKKNKYKHLTDRYILVVFAVETMGPWCLDAINLTSEIGGKLQAITGDPRCTNFLRQRLSIAIQQGNAASVLGTFPDTQALDEIFLCS